MSTGPRGKRRFNNITKTKSLRPPVSHESNKKKLKTIEGEMGKVLNQIQSESYTASAAEMQSAFDLYTHVRNEYITIHDDLEAEYIFVKDENRKQQIIDALEWVANAMKAITVLWAQIYFTQHKVTHKDIQPLFDKAQNAYRNRPEYITQDVTVVDDDMEGITLTTPLSLNDSTNIKNLFKDYNTIRSDEITEWKNLIAKRRTPIFSNQLLMEFLCKPDVMDWRTYRTFMLYSLRMIINYIGSATDNKLNEYIQEFVNLIYIDRVFAYHTPFTEILLIYDENKETILMYARDQLDELKFKTLLENLYTMPYGNQWVNPGIVLYISILGQIQGRPINQYKLDYLASEKMSNVLQDIQSKNMPLLEFISNMAPYVLYSTPTGDVDAFDPENLCTLQPLTQFPRPNPLPIVILTLQDIDITHICHKSIRLRCFVETIFKSLVDDMNRLTPLPTQDDPTAQLIKEKQDKQKDQIERELQSKRNELTQSFNEAQNALVRNTVNTMMNTNTFPNEDIKKKAKEVLEAFLNIDTLKAWTENIKKTHKDQKDAIENNKIKAENHAKQNLETVKLKEQMQTLNLDEQLKKLDTTTDNKQLLLNWYELEKTAIQLVRQKQLEMIESLQINLDNLNTSGYTSIQNIVHQKTGLIESALRHLGGDEYANVSWIHICDDKERTLLWHAAKRLDAEPLQYMFASMANHNSFYSVMVTPDCVDTCPYSPYDWIKLRHSQISLPIEDNNSDDASDSQRCTDPTIMQKLNYVGLLGPKNVIKPSKLVRYSSLFVSVELA